MPSKKEQLPFPYSRLMHCLEQTKSQSMELAIGSLHPFPNHPFQDVLCIDGK